MEDWEKEIESVFGNKVLMDEYLRESYKSRSERTMEQAIMWKFPEIENLRVDDGNISFNDDGIHTKKMIEDFIEELKTFGK